MDLKLALNPSKVLQNAKSKSNVSVKPGSLKLKFSSKLTIDNSDKENVSQSQVRVQRIKPRIVKLKGHEQYLPNILAHLHTTASKNAPLVDAFDHQLEINRRMRAILFNWLLEICAKYNLKTRTIFLAANVFDRYALLRHIERSQLQLVGIACLLIASKFEDIYPPELSDFHSLSDKVYTPQQIVDQESDVLMALKFELVSVAAIDVAQVRSQMTTNTDSTADQATELIMHMFLFHSNVAAFGPVKLAEYARVAARKLMGYDAHEATALCSYDLQVFNQDFIEIIKLMKSNRLFALEAKYNSLFHKLLASVFN